jgi:hypothetical protein
VPNKRANVKNEKQHGVGFALISDHFHPWSVQRPARSFSTRPVVSITERAWGALMSVTRGAP